MSMALEVDEPHWHPPGNSHDRRRDVILRTLGYTVVRLDATPFYGDVTEMMVDIVRDAVGGHQLTLFPKEPKAA